MLNDYFKDVKQLFTSPTSFIKGKKTITDFKTPFLFLLTSSILSVIVYGIFELIKGTGVFVTLFGVIFGLIIALILNFAMIGLFHLFIMLFGGKKPFTSTFKAFAYLAPFQIIGSILVGFPIAFLSFILNVYVFILLVKSVIEFTELKGWKLAGAWICYCLVILALILILVFLFESQFSQMGLSLLPI